MRASAPPPAARSGGHYLSRSAFYARCLAIVLGLVVSTRFAAAALSHALDVTTGAVAVKPHPRPHPSTMDVLPPLSSLTPARQAALAPVPSTDSPLAGRPLSVMLGVDYGSPRSDVYVNGRKVGQTPFVGDTSCKSGQQLKIEIVPAKGLPYTYLRDCLGGSLQIETAPP
jgi:hypothetical protein